MGRTRVARSATATNSSFVIFAPFVVEELLHHWTKRQENFAVDFVKHLRETGVDRGESAENPYVTGELFEPGTCINEIANG